MIRTLLIFTLCLFSIALSAQIRSVSGTVKAKDDGLPMIGVNVIIKGTATGTSTDVDGVYRIDVTVGQDTLIFTYLGYITRSMVIGSSDVMDVVLSPDVEILDNVVVVGYGKQRKSDLTGAVSSIRGADLTKITSQSPVQALQGKVAGVQVTSISGEPGSAPVVRVRGVGTFNNSSPIYVVDGIILNDISFLNSADIASMEVLKDASATAIYGSRGANGVIIVTTKQGKIGQEQPSVSFGMEYSTQLLAKKIELLDGPEFANYVNQFNPGTYNNLDAVPSTDWQNLVFHDAPMQNYQLSVSGASDKSQYYVGLGYFNQQGIIDKSSYERVSLQLNNTYLMWKNIRVGNNLTFTPYTEQTAPNLTYAAYRAQPVISPFNPDGSFAEVIGVGNPLAEVQNSNDFTRGLRVVGNIFGEVNFLKSFTARTSFAVDMGYNENRNFTPAFFVAPQQQNELSDLFIGNFHNLTWLWENTLNFKRVFGKHSFDILAGYTMQQATSEFMGANGENIIGDSKNLWYLNTDNIVPTSINNAVDPNNFYSIISYLFRANYSYHEKYLLTATFRRDGSSKFLDNNRWGNFPSFAAGWNISNEEFMQDISLISNLKIRASWGLVGNEKINYVDQYALVLNGINSVFGSGETLVPGSSYGLTGNPDLKWESTRQTDVGLEVGILKNSLTGEFDFYNRQTDDILVQLSTPGFFGNGEGAKVRYNAGSVLNRGFEFNLAWTQDIKKFHYRIGVLGSTLHNEVLTVGGNSGVDSVLFGGELGNGSFVTISSEGNPIGSYYGYHVIGVFQNQNELDSYPHETLTGVGDFKFEDVNGDGNITSADRIILGSSIPTFIYGFSVEGAFRGFDLSLDFQGQTGNDIYNGKEEIRPDLYNFESHVVNYWNGDGTSNTEPKPSAGGINYLPSDYFIQNGSFLRLRSTTLGYTFPKKIISKLKMSQARIYLRGTNIFTLTKYTGYTPEISTGLTNGFGEGRVENILSSGIDLGVYPITTVYSLGFNLTF